MTEVPGFMQLILAGLLVGMAIGVVSYTLLVFVGPATGMPILLCRDTLTNRTVPCPVSVGGRPTLPNGTVLNWSVKV